MRMHEGRNCHVHLELTGSSGGDDIDLQSGSELVSRSRKTALPTTDPAETPCTSSAAFNASPSDFLSALDYRGLPLAARAHVT